MSTGRNGPLYRALDYHAIYDALQSLIFKSGTLDYIVRNFIAPASGCRILDLGCGTGSIVPYLRDVSYLGIDSSENHIGHVKSRFSGRAGFRFEVGSIQSVEDFERFGIRPNEFDIVLMKEVIHHLPDTDVIRVLSVVPTLLEGGGRFVSMDPCFVDDQNPVSRFLARRDRGLYVRHEREYHELLSGTLRNPTITVEHALFRVPYSFIFCVASA
jgi:SAM-dependent methyltransferase